MKTGSTAIVTTPSGSPAGLYQGSIVTSPLLNQLPINSEVVILADDGLWAQVKSNIGVGYVMTVFLSPMDTEVSSTESYDFEYYKEDDSVQEWEKEKKALKERVAFLERRVKELEGKLGKVS